LEISKKLLDSKDYSHIKYKKDGRLKSESYLFNDTTSIRIEYVYSYDGSELLATRTTWCVDEKPVKEKVSSRQDTIVRLK
jgi:hypothetical protein